jgi:DNA-binding transcriptional MerR regulator/effector-binding domain-containing protein
MLSIGEFSHTTRLTVKTLRYYQELGILLPARTDEFTGYRYYDRYNFERAKRIVMLKQLGFTLKEIAAILDECREEADLKRLIDKKLKDVEKQLQSLREMKRELERFKSETEVVEPGADYTGIVEFEFHLPAYASFPIRGRYEEIGRGFSALFKRYGRFALGKPYAFFTELEYREEDAVMEAVLELDETASSGIEGVKEFPPVRGVKMIHPGAYGLQGPVYMKLFDYCRCKGYSIKPPIIEHYLKGPGMIFQGNPERYRTECIVLVGQDMTAGSGRA